jgi:uncharacterized protein
MTRKLMVVTGASAGIGTAFARRYAQAGWDVALTARRKDRLNTVADEIRAKHSVEALCYDLDLGAAGAVDDLLARIAKDGRVVDGVVNNAGYGLPGTYANTTWADQAAFLQVLLTAPLELAHKTLPGMLERRFGRIVNIASLAGLIPGSAGHTLYSAVKAALIKASQSMNAECQRTGVNVTAVCPGFTYSEFHDVNGTRDQVSQMPKWMWKSADEVAEIGFQANERDQAVVVTGGANKGIATIAKLLPDPIGEAIVRGNSSRFRNMSDHP